MRRDPVVGSLHRVAAKDFELSGYKVPKGKLLMLPLKYLAAHDPRFEQDNSHVFMPERMMTAEAQKKGDQMPFGYGPRCVQLAGGREFSSSGSGVDFDPGWGLVRMC
jgi:cytochrome P450